MARREAPRVGDNTRITIHDAPIGAPFPSRFEGRGSDEGLPGANTRIRAMMLA
jgi:hypothetical protein